MCLPKTFRDENCLYLIQDLQGMDTYDRAKAIVNFCDKETKQFEKEIDKAIIDIFERNGISIPNTDKSVLKRAFDMLKGKGKSIAIVDLYEKQLDHIIKRTKNHFNVILDENRFLECGVEVKEKEIKL